MLQNIGFATSIILAYTIAFSLKIFKEIIIIAICT